MARRGKEYFVRLDSSLLASPSYRDLSPPARALLMEFMIIYRPVRNGALTITEARAQGLIKSSEKITARSFYELTEHGFLKLMKAQSWTKKEGREFAVTFHPVNDREPTNEYLRWSKGENMQPDFRRPKWLRQ